MKIAVTGKGGVGKTIISAGLAREYAKRGRKVLAIDADPDANLASTLGFPNSSRITPLIEMKDLIEERTGAKPGSYTSFFKLNPRVEDIPDNYSVCHQGICLMMMGTVRGGGLGCTCPENAFLKALLSHLLLERREVVILDMEAGLEHLGRGTARGVDKMLIVVEPGRRSIETAFQIKKLAGELQITNLSIIGNKIRNQSDSEFLRENLAGLNLLGFISYDPEIPQADMANRPPLEGNKNLTREIKAVVTKIEEM